MTVHEGLSRRSVRTSRLRLLAAIGLPLAVVIAVIVSLLVGRGGEKTAGGGKTTIPPVTHTSWHVVWSDDFSGTSLNPRKWAVENDSTYGDGNKELACLMDRPQNVQLQNGLLYLRVQRESAPFRCGNEDTRFPNGRPYTSAMITTKGKQAWHGGLFEVRAKLPTTPGASRGLWPAFWMRPESPTPSSGEIDIFESVGSSPGPAATDSSGVHQTFWAKGIPRGRTTTTVRTDRTSPSQGFHTYGVQWEHDRLTWLVDGKATFSASAKQYPTLIRALTGQFYLRLNVAVGGLWPGSPDKHTHLPAALVVDWVRVSQPG